MIIADANLIAYLWLSSDFTPIAEQVFKKDPDWAAPLLWKSELRNVVRKYIAHGIIDENDALLSIQYAEEHLNDKGFDVDSKTVVRLSISSSCSTYDCEYVALAKEFDVPLLTFDKKVLKEFPNVAIHPEEFLKE